MAILFSSRPSSQSLLLLRRNHNPSPQLLPPFSISFPLKPAASRQPSLRGICASLLPPTPPPPPPPFLSTIISSASSFFRSLIHSAVSLLKASITRDSLRRLMIHIAGAMLICLYIYESMLRVRLYFPELPWHREPLTTLKDICDPFLSFSRKIVPPLFHSSDFSADVGIHVLIGLNLVLNYAYRSVR